MLNMETKYPYLVVPILKVDILKEVLDHPRNTSSGLAPRGQRLTRRQFLASLMDLVLVKFILVLVVSLVSCWL